jgi:hypothetical protein
LARFKTFQATGVAPDGRLYAGDLNGIQDLYLPLSDFTSTVDVGTLRVGDATLQLYKYGAGEFRMTGHMRFDGILRGLGGMVAGAFTTTQRDAIPIGSRPYGLVILNTTLNQYQWNKGTDAVPVWDSIGTGTTPSAHAATHAPGAADPIGYTLVNLRGTIAARPAAAAGNAGLLYFAYDEDGGTMYRSTGSAWEKSSPSVAFSSGVPPGTMTAYGGTAAPTGWLLCDGAAVSRTTYAALFTAISTNYGVGNGSTTFNVPDLRGRVAVGISTGGKSDVNALADNEGVAANLRNVKHTHRMWNRGITDGGQTISWTQDLGAGSDLIGGSDSDNVNTPAYLVVNYIIKT